MVTRLPEEELRVCAVTTVTGHGGYVTSHVTTVTSHGGYEAAGGGALRGRRRLPLGAGGGGWQQQQLLPLLPREPEEGRRRRSLAQSAPCGRSGRCVPQAGGADLGREAGYRQRSACSRGVAVPLHVQSTFMKPLVWRRKICPAAPRSVLLGSPTAGLHTLLILRERELWPPMMTVECFRA